MRYLVLCVLSLGVVLLTPYQLFGFDWFGTTDKVITTKEDDVIGKEIKDSNDAFRDGTELIAEGIGDADNNDKIYYQEITSTEQSWAKTADYVRALINYALAIMGLVALLYVAYHGFLTLTAGDNDGQAKKGREGMRYGALALLGIAVAWFVVSLIVRLIQKISTL